jgi:hypothetical protein
MPTRRRALLILAALAVLAQLSIALALMVGSIAINPAEVLATCLVTAAARPTTWCAACVCRGH